MFMLVIQADSLGLISMLPVTGAGAGRGGGRGRLKTNSISEVAGDQDLVRAEAPPVKSGEQFSAKL